MLKETFKLSSSLACLVLYLLLAGAAAIGVGLIYLVVFPFSLVFCVFKKVIEAMNGRT